MGITGQARRLPGWVYRARDVAEFNRHMPRNSPIGNQAHLWSGLGLTVGGSVGAGNTFFPKATEAEPGQFTREDWIRMTGNGAGAGGALIVIMTMGAQRMTPHADQLARGLAPLYFLGVGMGVAGTMMVPAWSKAYAQ